MHKQVALLRVEVHIHVYVPTRTLHILNYPERKPIGMKGLRHTMLCLIEASSSMGDGYMYKCICMTSTGC